MIEPVLIDLDGSGDPTEIFAYIAIDRNEKSGICAGDTPSGFLPFVGSTRESMKKWKPYISEIKELGTDKKIELVKFKAAEVIKE